MSEPGPAAAEPPRRRESWSIRRIAEDIGGRPISDFQEPAGSQRPSGGRGAALAVPSNRPITPSPGRATPEAPARGAAFAPASAASRVGDDDAPIDPVQRVYPPLTRGTGRALHGAEHEHHVETLATVRGEAEPTGPGHVPHPPGPSTRPERIYLHYLLLHLDRLNDHALDYLAHAVREERDHRHPPKG
ncbi:MAG TPA: hypothetical protein VGV64_00320 [Thermoplasmata archaeon]|nr:hypothetical protein [Thermoplasmata archaeon]HEV2428281.1 hypothetical protein [Thermoplasmata archaeon]